MNDRSFWKFFDRYDFRTRVLAGLFAMIPVSVCVGMLSAPTFTWYGGAGIGIAFGLAVLAAVAYAARAAGKRIEDRLWPSWGGPPTTRWLRPDDDHLAQQEKVRLYRAIKLLTGINLNTTAKAGDPKEMDRTIEAAIRQLRHELRNQPESRMLTIHLEEYGFARNLTGLRWVLVSLAGICMAISGAASLCSAAPVAVVFIEALLLLLMGYAAFFFSPAYVRQCADRYAETLFSTAQAKANKQTDTAG